MLGSFNKSEQLSTRMQMPFSNAMLTCQYLTPSEEKAFKKVYARYIAYNNHAIGYPRKQLSALTDISSSQFSRAIDGQYWINLANMGFWGFACGKRPIKLEANIFGDSIYDLCCFVNGRLCQFSHKEFEYCLRLIMSLIDCSELEIDWNIFGPIPDLTSKEWKHFYSEDLDSVHIERLILLRNQLEISCSKMANILDVTADTIRRYESRTIRINKGIIMCARIYKSFNVTPNELIYGSLHEQLLFVQHQRYIILRKIFTGISPAHIKKVYKLISHISDISSECN